MPYTKPERRKQLDPKIDALLDHIFVDEKGQAAFGSVFMNDNDLHYILTRVVRAIYSSSVSPADDYVPTYQELERALGLLESVKHDLYQLPVVEYSSV